MVLVVEDELWKVASVQVQSDFYGWPTSYLIENTKGRGYWFHPEASVFVVKGL
jgi:hypothetical protein